MTTEASTQQPFTYPLQVNPLPSPLSNNHSLNIQIEKNETKIDHSTWEQWRKDIATLVNTQIKAHEEGVHLSGDGDVLETCGKPAPHHEFKIDGTRVWGPHQCTSRNCPICCDRRYTKDASKDVVANLLGVGAKLLAHGRLYDFNGRSLKLYSYIYSRKENDDDVKKARSSCAKELKNLGMISGYNILHPFRGKHDPNASPKECREAMDRTRLSIHIHGYCWGYWNDGKNPDGQYIHFEKVFDIRDFKVDVKAIGYVDKLIVDLQYPIGHSGWFGKRGQSITSWGLRLGTKEQEYKPPSPGVLLKHPTMVDDVDGQPYWEKRNTPSREVWDEFTAIKKSMLSCDFDGRIEASGVFEEAISGGKVYKNNLHPWYCLDEIDRQPDHSTWYSWRTAISGTIQYLIDEHYKGPP